MGKPFKHYLDDALFKINTVNKEKSTRFMPRIDALKRLEAMGKLNRIQIKVK
ncbi:hypothetical protein [Viridibacillus arvi]|uniref:hypothetical protein n=1 Tax=Viridibacillus arvi TaxID=263475 RepID=UPI0034CF8EE4